MQLVPVGRSPEETEAFLQMLTPYWAELASMEPAYEPLHRTQYRRLLLDRERLRFSWIEEGDRRVGFCVYRISTHWYRGDVIDGYVEEFYVLPEARRSGVGREAAEAMVEACRAEGCRRMHLSVLLTNERALAFWRSVGFAPLIYRMTRDLNLAATPSKAAATFQTALASHLEAIARRDLERYAASLSEGEVTLVMPNGRLLRGREAVLDFHRGWFADRDWVWTPQTVETHEGGGLGTALCDVIYRDVDGSGAPVEQRLWVSLTFAQEDGEWRLVHDQNTLQAVRG